MAAALGELLDGFTRDRNAASVQRMQDGLGDALARLGTIESEVRRERLTHFSAEPGLAPLLRTLLRLRHDLVMIGRAAIVPLPDAFQARLGPALAHFRETATDYLRQISGALIDRRAPSALDAVDETLGDYTAAMAALRSEGLTRKLLGDEVERIFTLGFALEQLHRNFRDLERCVAGIPLKPPLGESSGAAREIVLVDRTRERAKAVATDIRYCAPLSPMLDIRDGDYTDRAGAALVMITAGVNEKSGGAIDCSDAAGRLKLFATNRAIDEQVVPRVVEAAPTAAILVVTDPPDPLADIARQFARHDRVLSMGTYLDSLRFRVHLAARLGVSTASVDAMVL
jgi:hypothetical protein